jgi:tetratricopeptide (TPR) repeat protein
MVLPVAGLCVGWLAGPHLGFGQASGKKGKPAPAAQLRQLDQQAQRAQEQFLAELEQLAKGYEDAGQTERAKEMLQEILKIRPDHPDAQQTLARFAEQVFRDNSLDVDVEAAHGWTSAGVAVRQGQAIRFEATGTYRYIVNETLGPDGFPRTDVVNEMADLPAGALVGVVVPPPAPGEQPRADGPVLKSRPFLVGSANEFSPAEDGLLYLKLNTPPNSKSTGKVRVKISGNLRRPGG